MLKDLKGATYKERLLCLGLPYRRATGQMSYRYTLVNKQTYQTATKLLDVRENNTTK